VGLAIELRQHLVELIVDQVADSPRTRLVEQEGLVPAIWLVAIGVSGL
jgi:hypothetical protein